MAKRSAQRKSAASAETTVAMNVGVMEDDDNEPREQHLQGVPCTWKGFLSNTSPQIFDVFKTKNVIKISVGNKHCAFLTDEHAVYCYGSGEFGQLGHKKFTDVAKQPILVQELKSENVIDVVCGANHTGAVCSDGIVFCWGDSSSGQCGTGESEKISTPRQVEVSDTDTDPVVTQIACGDTHTLALTTHGEVWAWGTGPQLGLGTGTTPVLLPRKVDALVGRKVLQISTGAIHSLAIIQKIKNAKLGTLKRALGEDEESGSGTLSGTLSLNETFVLTEEDDVVIITDTRIKDSAAEARASPRSFSPDSIDLEAKQLLEQNGRIRDGGEEGYASSECTEGTYTLNDSQKDIKSIGDSDIIANGDIRTSDQTDGTVGSEDESCIKNGAKPQPCTTLPTSSATLEYFAQLKPKRPTSLSSKERILASLPTAVSSKLEKLLSPRLSIGLGLWQSPEALKGQEENDGEEEVEESLLNKSQTKVRSTLEVQLDQQNMPTEVWSWGKGASGQLGQGDPLDKPVPTAIKQLSNKNIMRVVAGTSHSIAISSNGVVYSWGGNTDGQLGHTGQLVPKRIKMPNNALVWDAAAGNTHTLLVADGNSFQPDVYYLGKQPSLQELRSEGRTPNPESPSLKDKEGRRRSAVSIAKGPTVKYAGRAKQPEKLGFIRKSGWVQAIAAAGDMCACIVDKNVSGFTSILHELTATERLIHNQLSVVKTTILRTLQSPETHKALEKSMYSLPFKLIVDSFSGVTNAVAQNSTQLTSIVQKNHDLADLVMLKNIKEYVAMYEQYAVQVCNFMTIGGFAHLGKVFSDALSKHESVFCELLNEAEKPPSFGPPLRTLMKLPLDRIKCYAYLLKKLTDYFAKDSPEHQALTSASASWETLQSMLDSKLADAEETRKFWESCPVKLAESVKSPDRRLLRESRTKPLNLAGSGRLTTHWFLLFNDIFVHAQAEGKSGKTGIPSHSATAAAASKTLDVSKFSTHQSFSLGLIWAEPIPDSDQVKNALQLVMPEENLVLSASTPAEKAEWLWSINQAIDNILTNQKTPNASPTAEVTTPNRRVPPKLARNGCYTFYSHAKYKDATYEGMWYLGKPHGKGSITWPDGKKFTGHFIQGQQQGVGVYTVPSPDGKGKPQVYEGQFDEGKMTGIGTLRYHNGDIYQGKFQTDIRHGHGVFHGCTSPSSPKPNLFIGEWQDDHRHGYGVMEDTQRGEKYMGMWENDVRHGNGLVITLDGLYYEGTFTQNKLQGTGVLLTEDGTVYEGELITGPTLNGKGKMTLPNGDFMDGTFNGLWGDGVKVNGTFTKGKEDMEEDRNLNSRYTVLAYQKWSGIFEHCQSLLGYRGDEKPDCHRAWEAIAVALSTGRRHLESQAMVKEDCRKFSSTLEDLERIPINNRGKITEDDYKAMQMYLAKAFDTSFHPLGQLMESLVIAYRETYIGLGAHRWLLPYAVEEIKSYIKRIYHILRVLFPELPNEDPSKPCTPISEHPPMDFHYYYDYSDDQAAAISPALKRKGENHADDISPRITSDSLLYPLLVPRIYPALFTLYALKNEKEDQKYRDQLRRLNKQPDIALMAYLSVDQKFWLFEEALVKEPPKKLSEICEETFVNAVDCLQKISTTFSPRDKLQVIKSTWDSITEPLQEKHGADSLGMDELFPIFHYVVIRARIPQLGSEIQIINDLLGVKSDLGQWGHMYTTLEGCYLLTIDETIEMP